MILLRGIDHQETKIIGIWMSFLRRFFASFVMGLFGFSSWPKHGELVALAME